MLRLLKLESRIVLDGAGIGDAEDHAAESAHELPDHISDADTDSDSPDAMEDSADAEVIAGAAALLSDSPEAEGGLQVVLISDSLPDHEALVDAAEDDALVIVFDADGETAAEVLAKVTDAAETEGRVIGSLTILSHGGEGFFHLGTELVTSDSLASEDGAAAWSGLNEVMDDDAHLYVFGCNVSAESDADTPLLSSLSRISGASVFASSDVTGAGGDWDLESVYGADADDADPPLNMDALVEYDGVLTTSLPLNITTLEDSPGSYRIFIYGPGENSGSQNTSSVIQTTSSGEPMQNITLRYDGWITTEPRVIDGVDVNEYHRWSLDYDPVQHNNGQTIVNFTVNGAPMSTTVNILPVNDPPEFLKGPDQVVPADSGQHTITNWATGIRPGPALALDEAGQNVTFFAANDNENLFSEQPTISDDGTLVFTPAPGQTGVATVDVYVEDDGGTDPAKGDENTSPVQTFTITILNPVEYVENDPAEAIYSGLNLAGNPVDNITGATVRITENYQSLSTGTSYLGQDVLAANTTGNITSDWNPETGTLTLSGDASLAEYQAALRTVTFDHTDNETGDAFDGDDPRENSRMVTFSITPQGQNSVVVLQREVDVDAVNDAPDLQPESAPQQEYVENEPPVVIDPTFIVSDIDDDNMTGATIQFVQTPGMSGTSYVQGQDVLSFSNTGNINGTWNEATGILTLAGTATKAEYQTALRSVAYSNTSEAPAEHERTISFTLTDENSRGFGDGPDGTGGALSDTVYRTLSVTVVPDPPGQPNTNDLEDIYEDNQGLEQILSDPSDPGSDYLPQLNDGDLVSEIVQSILDPDEPNGQGAESIAVVGVDDSNGTWEYWTGGDVANDANWQPVNDGSLGATHALLLDADARIRFMPKENFNTQRVEGVSTPPKITYHAWDGTTINGKSSGDYTAIADNDPAFSEDPATSSVTVLAVNDAPVIQNLPGRGEVTLATPLVISDVRVDDIDIAEGGKDHLTVEISAGKGTLRLAPTSGVTFGGQGNGSGSFTVTGTSEDVNAALKAMTYTADETAYMDFQAKGTPDAEFDSIQIQSNDNGNYGLPGVRIDAGSIPVYLGNTGPVIDLDPDDDSEYGDVDDPSDPAPPVGPADPPIDGTFNVNVYFIEDVPCNPVNIVDAADANQGAIVFEPDGDLIRAMDVNLTNYKSGDELNYAIPETANIIVTQESTVTGALVLHFEGEAEASVYDGILKTVTFNTDSLNPDTTDRIIHVTATDEHGNIGNVATSRVYVVAVNDAPENLLSGQKIDGIVEIAASTNQNLILNLSVDDQELNPALNPDREFQQNEITVKLTVDAGILTVNALTSDAVRGNGSGSVTLTGTFDGVNGMLNNVSYSPDQDFSGTAVLIMTTNDHGYTGINPEDVVNCSLSENILDSDGKVLPISPSSVVGTVTDPTALLTVSTIRINVIESDDNPISEPPEGPNVPTPPIVRPDGYIDDALRPGAVDLPGVIGVTGGQASIQMPAMGPGGRDVIKPFCSIEQALRENLGCRFANTMNDESRIGSFEWSWMRDELGWTPPYEHLDEEWDLYSQLFLREEGDPGFNVNPGELESEHGGMPEAMEPVMDPNSREQTLNDMGPEELKKAFFAHRPELDKTWR